MDSDRRNAFLELLFAECDDAGSTLLFVSHDQSLQTPFDRVVEFDEINRSAKANPADTAGEGAV